MKIFYLPDLGEGLPDAEISHWHVKVGETIAVDQPLVAMETAKALVDVPSPESGIIAKLYGNSGDIIKTGAPLVGFESTDAGVDSVPSQDQGTVVGNIESTGRVIQEDFIIGKGSVGRATQAKATPAVRNLARTLGVDLEKVPPTGPQGLVTQADVEAFAGNGSQDPGFEPLRGVRRTMVQRMMESHQVVAVSLCDDADLHRWPIKTDLTARLIQAIVFACREEPALNAWYDEARVARKLHSSIHLGLAIDTPEGLFVPVIFDSQQKNAETLRQCINDFKEQAKARTLPTEVLTGATITLSNFGNFAGRYANPIVVPPTVAIVGVGRLREAVVAYDGKPAVHKILPLSLSFDHRAVTGGEASRFLGAIIQNLEQKA